MTQCASEVPGPGEAVVSVLAVVNRGVVTPACLAPVTLSLSGGLLVVMDLVSGSEMGCRVVLVAV